MRLLSGGRRITLADVGGPRAGAWSPDGQWIAFLRSQTGKVQLALCDLPKRVYSSTLQLAGPFQVIGFADLRFGSAIAPVSASDTDRL